MREFKNKKNVVNFVLFILLLSSLLVMSIDLKAQPPTIVKGFVYIDGKITQPKKVNLTFSFQCVNATIHDQGYLIVITGEETGSIGVFSIVYNETIYTPDQKITISENMYIYNIDLYINSSDGGQPYIEPKNIEPIADAGGPYFEAISVSIQFNGTKSIDPDGTIVKYEWNFGDKSNATEATPLHVYKRIGNYTVTLTVTDNNGNSTQNSTYALITRTFNYPPDKPQINGSTTGAINTDYNFTIQATDPDMDKIKYSVNWSDDTENTTTEYLLNGTILTLSHNWTEPGIYTIKAYIIDDNDAISEKSELDILIDTIYCQDIGYLIDKSSDGTYDIFYSNNTQLENSVDFTDGLYLIDTNNDGKYDYKFNKITNELSSYSVEVKEQEASLLDIIKPFLQHIIIILVAILLILAIPMLLSLIKPKLKTQKSFYIGKMDKLTENENDYKQKDVESKYKKFRSVEEEVDEFLSRIK